MRRSFLEWLSQFNGNRKPINTTYLQVPHFLRTIIDFFWIIGKFFLKLSLLSPIISISIIPTRSMSETILSNDIVVASGIYYGITLPLVGQVINWPYTKPMKGDVVSFSMDFIKYTLAKRIIGEEGDTVQFINGTLFINDQPCQLVLGDYITFYENEIKLEGTRYEEIMPSGQSHNVFFVGGNPSKTNYCNTEKFVIPKDYYMLVGDNRGGSSDSRSYLGFVHKSEIDSKILFILFSNASIRTVNILRFLSGFRFERFFTWIK